MIRSPSCASDLRRRSILRDEARRLHTAAAIQDQTIHSGVYEKVIANLRWRGEEGATVLQVILPLMQTLLQQPKHSGYEPLLALVAIAHRIGRKVLVTMIVTTPPDDRGSAERMAEAFLSRPADEVEASSKEMFREQSSADGKRCTGALQPTDRTGTRNLGGSAIIAREGSLEEGSIYEPDR